VLLGFEISSEVSTGSTIKLDERKISEKKERDTPDKGGGYIDSSVYREQKNPSLLLKGGETCAQRSETRKNSHRVGGRLG